MSKIVHTPISLSLSLYTDSQDFTTFRSKSVLSNLAMEEANKRTMALFGFKEADRKTIESLIGNYSPHRKFYQ